MKSETTSLNFLCSLKSTGRPCPLDRISCTGHLENIDSLSYVVLPNVDICNTVLKRLHLLVPPPSSRQKSLRTGSFQIDSDRYNISTILIFTGNLEFHNWQQLLFVVRLTLFSRKCLSNMQVWLTIVCHLFQLKIP